MSSDIERTLDRVGTGNGRHALRYKELRSPIMANINDSSPQIQFDGNTKGVEAATQIGNRAWDYNFFPDCPVNPNGINPARRTRLCR